MTIPLFRGAGCVKAEPKPSASLSASRQIPVQLTHSLSGYTSGEAQIAHLVMSLGNNLVTVDPHIAIPRQYVHVRL